MYKPGDAIVIIRSPSKPFLSKAYIGKEYVISKDVNLMDFIKRANYTETLSGFIDSSGAEWVSTPNLNFPIDGVRFLTKLGKALK